MEQQGITQACAGSHKKHVLFRVENMVAVIDFIEMDINLSPLKYQYHYLNERKAYYPAVNQVFREKTEALAIVYI